MSDEDREQTPSHEPVLVEEVVSLLDPAPDAFVLDCTFGSGGHAEVLTDQLGPDGTYFAMDWDPEAPSYASFDPEELTCEFVFREANFARTMEVLDEWNGAESVDALLADLGWSMDQLRHGGKGLTFEEDEFMDMRYNPEAEETAADLLHRASVEELTELFRTHGEHRYGRELAEKIVEFRSSRPFRRTLDLMGLISSTVPEHRQRETAARVFQALRTEVNNELENLEQLLDQMPEVLAPGGRGCVISFHSLEDRRVKQSFQEGRQQGIYRLLTEKPVRPERGQVERNPSARSARLRAVERKAS